MAIQQIHIFYSEMFLGDSCQEIHEYLDQYYGVLGNNHRRKLHHKQEIDNIFEKRGHINGIAAFLHVLMDTGGYIPDISDYQTSRVDFWGVPKSGCYMPILNYSADGHLTDESVEILQSIFVKII